MLENLFNYTPLIAGKTMITIGISSALAMGVSSTLMNHMKIKNILMISLCVSSIGAFYFANISLNATQNTFRMGNLLFGFGLGFFMVPLTTYSLATLPEKHITEAAGLFSYGRMLGTSIGVSLLSTLVSRETQVNWEQLGEHISIFNHNLQSWLNYQHTTLHNPQTVATLQTSLSAQASMIAFVDAFYFIGFLLLGLIPLVFCLKNVKLVSTQMIH